MKRQLHLFQPQYDDYLDNGTIQSWLPYTVASLWCYAREQPGVDDAWQLSGLHYRRHPVDRVLVSMDQPDLCAFSLYVWNEQYSIEMARNIRDRWPQCRIVFGGPQSGLHHLDLGYVDTVVMGEGEPAFAKILQRVAQDQGLPTIMREPRMESLDIPSPYITGVFDDIIANAAPNQRFQAVLETNRGCPYACTYCDWGGLTFSKVKKFGLERVAAELEWIGRHDVTILYVIDANFGIFKSRDLEISRLGRRFLRDSMVEYVIINFLKNSNHQIFEIAREIGPVHKSVALSLQSLNPDTLKAIKRDNMKSNDLVELLALSKRYEIPTHTDMILGMPLETLASWKAGLIQLLEAGQDGYIDSNWINLLANTELKADRLRYGIRTVRVEADYLFRIEQGPDAVNDGIKEYSDVVCETSTMTRDDMVEAWMWHWLLQFFHTSGYTYIVSRYLSNMHAVPLGMFYERLHSMIRDGSGAITDQYHKIQRATRHFLTHGNFGGEIVPNEFTINSYVPIYSNIHAVYDLIGQTAASFATIDTGVWRLQTHAVLHPDFDTDVEFECGVDLETWQPKHTRYRVTRRIDNFEGSYYNFLAHRRRLTWRNRIQPVTQTQSIASESKTYCEMNPETTT